MHKVPGMKVKIVWGHIYPFTLGVFGAGLDVVRVEMLSHIHRPKTTTSCYLLTSLLPIELLLLTWGRGVCDVQTLAGAGELPGISGCG